MKLINADELSELLASGDVQINKAAAAAVIKLLKDAPVADPYKHEYWIGFDTTAYTGMDDFGEPIYSPRRFYRCHGCRIGSVVKSNFCPKCGAIMDRRPPWEEIIEG